MITRAGGLVLLGSVAVGAAGRVLGLVEGYVLASAGCLAVALAVLHVHLLGPRLALRRSVRPDRVHVGTPARVEVDVRSRGRLASPVVTLVDPIGGRSGARLRLAPLPPGTGVRASYRLPTSRRGEVEVGPLRVEAGDPFGLARRTRRGAERVRLLVLPHIDRIHPLPPPAGTEPLSGADGRTGPGLTGEEFHTLRPYVVGDDIRRVHWPMSARSDDLVVRQDDEPRQGRLTVVLDVTPGLAAHDDFEVMVSAAASIAAAHRARGDLVRLLTSDQRDTGWVAGQAAFDGLLEVLAVATPSPRADLDGVLRLTDAGAHSVVVVTGDRPAADLAALACHRSGRGARRTVLTVVRVTGPGAGDLDPVPGVRLVDVAGQPFPVAWERARSRRRAAAGSRA